MKLYHYTSYKNFKSIWESQSLRFGDCGRANDILESHRLKSTISPDSWKILDKQLSEYRQISFTMDFNECKKGFMSSMLWGHYGDKNQGVCIELDLEKLNIPPEVHHKPINYVQSKQNIHCNKLTSTDISHFINDNISEIFFTKLDDWQAENEYRLINNTNIAYLNISGAITAIYITWKFHEDGYMSRCWHRKCNILEKLVGELEVRNFFYTELQGVLIPACYSTRQDRRLVMENRRISKLAIEKLKKMQ